MESAMEKLRKLNDAEEQPQKKWLNIRECVCEFQMSHAFQVE